MYILYAKQKAHLNLKAEKKRAHVTEALKVVRVVHKTYLLPNTCIVQLYVIFHR